MKTKAFVLFNFLFVITFLNAQCPDPPVLGTISGNGVKATISNGGDLFFDGNDGQFFVPADVFPLRTTIFAAGLWLGGVDEGGNLKLSAQTYGRNNTEFDYIPGPLKHDTGENFENHCDDFNRIWIVERQDIINHILDFEDNGIIDNPITSIYAWPGNNSAQSFYYNGFFLPYNPQKWAPFYDYNNDGIYEPNDGDYPHPESVSHSLIPEQISWSVFNDNTFHAESGGDPLKVEIQLTTWNFNCFGNHVLKYSVFTSHKIINRSQQVIDSMYVGLWVDFDNGCYLDDYIGCSPGNDGFLVYNSDALDGESSATDCIGVETYGLNPPAQSVAFLNHKLDKFIFHNPFPACVGPPGQQYPPSSPGGYYNYLKGLWNDGTPITYGGSGYQSSGGDITNWVFPDNPNDSLGWSLFTLGAPDGDRRAVGSTNVGQLAPGEIFKLDMAHTYHGYSGLNNLESVDQAYIELAQMQQMYDMQFEGWCNYIVTETQELTSSAIEVFPNPSNGLINIKSEDYFIENVEVYDQLGKLVLASDFNHQYFGKIDLSNSTSGIYMLKINSAEKVIIRKVLIQ
jgi:Secretion system C-terminal sorting domain